MRRLAALILAIGLLASACSMPNFAPPKLHASVGDAVAVVTIR
jgi:hypothetical protein